MYIYIYIDIYIYIYIYRGCPSAKCRSERWDGRASIGPSGRDSDHVTYIINPFDHVDDYLAYISISGPPSLYILSTLSGQPPDSLSIRSPYRSIWPYIDISLRGQSRLREIYIYLYRGRY